MIVNAISKGDVMKVIGVNRNERRSTRRIGMSLEQGLKCVDGAMSME